MLIQKPPVMLHIDIDTDLANQTCAVNIRKGMQVDGFTLACLLLNAAAQIIIKLQHAAMMEIGKDKYTLEGGNDGEENNGNNTTGN
jgi:hypothetical protein